jgi:hypothetical protein
VSTVAKLITGAMLGAITATACIKLAETRSRNARLTPTRYIAPFPVVVSVGSAVNRGPIHSITWSH